MSGLYSAEILYGLAAAHPETRFDFCYRSHRFLKARRAEPIPPMCAAGCSRNRWDRAAPTSFTGSTSGFRRNCGRTVATFHDLFVITSEYSTPEFRARFRDQAQDAAARADAIIAVSEFTRGQVVSLLGVDPAKVHVVHHGTRTPGLLPATARKGDSQRGGRPEAKEHRAAWWRPSKRSIRMAAGAGRAPAGYGAEEILARIRKSPARGRIRVPGTFRRKNWRTGTPGVRFRLSLARRGLRHAGVGGDGARAAGDYVQPFRSSRGRRATQPYWWIPTM